MDSDQPPLPERLTFGFISQLVIFAVSVLKVLAWLLQISRRSRSSAAGPWALITALSRFPDTGHCWRRAWAQALNVESVRSQSSLKMQFEENFTFQQNLEVTDMTCTKHCDNCMIFCCNISVENVKFPVLVTQESLAAVSCETYQVSLSIQQAQVEVKLQELVQEGLLVSWSFKDRPDMLLEVTPSRSQQSTERSADLCTLQDLIQNALFSAEPAMIFTLSTNKGDKGDTGDKLLIESPSQSEPFRLIVQQLCLHNVMMIDSDVQLMCEAELDYPFQRKQSRAVKLQNKGEMCSVSWSEEMTFDLTMQSKELSLKVWQLSQSTDNVLLGYTLVALCSPSREMSRRHVYPLIPSPVLPKTTLQAISVEVNLIYATSGMTKRRSITPTKKVEMDRTVMPDGTLITTVTTIQSRPKFDGKIESALRSPTKVEVSENKPVVLPHTYSSGSSPSGSDGFLQLLDGSPISIKLDPVAETAIRQLTEPANKPPKRTPTKRSTLIISGVSKVPVEDDEMALSLGYAASMDASLRGSPNIIQDSLIEASTELLSEVALSLGRDTYDTTKSDISGWPSLDDVDSETGSIRALDTRSLKDHKVGFLRSGTRFPFNRHPQNAGLSQSHDDLSDAAAANSHKKIGSLPRRLLKHFSLKAKSKPSVNGSAQGGDK